jgi:hypothetical protein
VAHLDGPGGTPVCRGTPVAHHCTRPWTKSRNPVIIIPTYHRQNPLELIIDSFSIHEYELGIKLALKPRLE